MQNALELLDRVVHRQGKDHDGQRPHGVIGDGAAEQGHSQRRDGQPAGQIDGQGIGSGSQHHIYIPLGGSRAGKWKSFRNTLVIFLVSGFWHGANWTFVAWGAYHALLFLPLLLLGQNRRYRDSVAENSFLPSVKELTQMGVTFLLVLLGWILFRSEDISQAAVYLERMFNASLFSAPQLVGLGFGQLLLKKCFFFTALMFIVEWIGRKQAHGLMIEDLSLPVRYVIYTVLLIIIYGFDASNPQGFIYFQF